MPIGTGRRVPAQGNAYQTNNIQQPTFQQRASERMSGYGAVGLGFLSGDVDDDDDEEPPMPQQPQPASILRKPSQNGIPANPAAGRQYNRAPPPGLNSNQQFQQNSPPQKYRVPADQPQHPPSYANKNDRGPVPNNAPQPIARPAPRPAFIPESGPAAVTPMPPPNNRMAPHPLDAPAKPIVPVFVRPNVSPQQRDVKFSDNAILRGNSEETLLSKSTVKGADFWRRFSFIIKDEDLAQLPTAQKRSTWLEKNQSRSSRYSLCVWMIGITLLLVIGGVIALVWFLTHNQPASQPRTLAQSSNQASAIAESTTSASGTKTTASPLRTVTGDLPPSTTPAATAPAKRTAIAGYYPRAPPVITLTM